MFKYNVLFMATFSENILLESNSRTNEQQQLHPVWVLRCVVLSSKNLT